MVPEGDTQELRPDDEKPGMGTVFWQREQCHSVHKDKARRVGDTERAVWPDGSEDSTWKVMRSGTAEARTCRILQADVECGLNFYGNGKPLDTV